MYDSVQCSPRVKVALSELPPPPCGNYQLTIIYQ